MPFQICCHNVFGEFLHTLWSLDSNIWSVGTLTFDGQIDRSCGLILSHLCPCFLCLSHPMKAKMYLKPLILLMVAVCKRFLYYLNLRSNSFLKRFFQKCLETQSTKTESLPADMSKVQLFISAKSQCTSFQVNALLRWSLCPLLLYGINLLDIHL